MYFDDRQSDCPTGRGTWCILEMGRATLLHSIQLDEKVARTCQPLSPSSMIPEQVNGLTVICPKCKAINLDTATRCKWCSLPLARAQPRPQEEQKLAAAPAAQPQYIQPKPAQPAIRPPLQPPARGATSPARPAAQDLVAGQHKTQPTAPVTKPAPPAATASPSRASVPAEPGKLAGPAAAQQIRHHQYQRIVKPEKPIQLAAPQPVQHPPRPTVAPPHQDKPIPRVEPQREKPASSAKPLPPPPPNISKSSFDLKMKMVMRCPGCGKKLEDGNFCKHCGTKLG